MRIFYFFILLLQLTFAKETLSLFTFNKMDDVLFENEGSLYLPRLAETLKNERRNAVNSLTFITGDFLSPNSLSALDKGSHIIDILNYLKIDFANLGNHEFDFGIDVLQKRIAESNFPYLTSNIIKIDNEKIANTMPYTIYELNDIKIGFIGLITEKTKQLSLDENKIYFLSAVEKANEITKALKKQNVDIIIAISHLSYGEIVYLSNVVKDINMIIGCHDKEIMTVKNKETYIFAPPKDKDLLYKIDIVLEKKDNLHIRDISFSPLLKIINLSNRKDVAVQNKIEKYKHIYKDLFNEKIARFKKDIDSRLESKRTRNLPICSFFAKAIRKKMNADIGFLTAGTFHGDNFYKQNEFFTKADLFREICFDDEIVVIEVSGEELMQALENGVSMLEKKDSRFPQVDGIKYSFDVNKRPFERVFNVFINEEKLKKERIYSIATTKFLADGGDGYFSFYGKTKKNVAKDRFLSIVLKKIQQEKKNPFFLVE